MVTKKIAKAMAAWSTGENEILALGHLDSRRDWGYAGEYVEAMHLMLQQPESDDYVIGTGKSHSVKDFLEEAAMEIGADWDFVEKHIRIDERLKRPQEIRDMKADATKFWIKAGWAPKVGLRELVRMMIRAELNRLNAKAIAGIRVSA
jgi:GDPmannose 4,6-dehydratase